LAAFMEWIWLQTTLSPWQLFYGAVILTGVGLALAPGGEKKIRSGFRLGLVFAIVAALGQGLGAVVSRKAFEVAARAGQDIDGGTAAYQRVLGGLLFGGLFYFLIVGGRILLRPTDQRTGPTNGTAGPGNLVKRSWVWVLLNSLAGPAIGVAFYQLALKTTPTGVVLPIVATTPLAVIPFAWYIEGDRPSRMSLVGAVVAVIGAIALARVT
jgi:drug/metabolite transporter (DMT)-like permease